MLKHTSSSKIIPERVVVMGSGGFIGTVLVKTLNENKIPTLALGRSNLDLLDSDASNRLLDILDQEDTLIVISAIAPCKNIQMIYENILMMKAVCEAIEKKEPKHLIYLSSDAVYSDSPDPLTETSCAEPGSLHGAMHLVREVMLKEVFSGTMAILRPSLIYGAEDTHNGYGPNQFFNLAFANKGITLFGEGEERRDHVYIEDLINILLLVTSHRSEGILNIATGSVSSFREVAHLVSNFFSPYTAIKSKPRIGPMPHNGYRPFDPSSCLSAFPEFRYTTLKEGLEKTFEEMNLIYLDSS